MKVYLPPLRKKLEERLGPALLPRSSETESEVERARVCTMEVLHTVSLAGLALLDRRNNYVGEVAQAAVRVITDPSAASHADFQTLLFTYNRDMFPMIFPVEYATKDVMPLYLRKYLELLKDLKREEKKISGKDFESEIENTLGEVMTFLLNNWKGTLAVLLPSSKAPEGPQVRPLPGSPPVSGKVKSLSHRIKVGLYLLSEHNQPLALNPFYHYESERSYAFRMLSVDGLFYQELGKAGYSLLFDQDLIMEFGGCLFHLGAFGRAIHLFRLLEGENREALILVSSLNHCINAASLMEKNEPQRALNEWELALKVRPDLPVLYHKAADACIAANKFSRAVELLNRLLERYPVSDEACMALGDVYAAKGDFGRAKRAYEKALILNPYNRRAAKKQTGMRERLARDTRKETDKPEEFPSEVLCSVSRVVADREPRPLLGRAPAIEQLMGILACRDKHNALIVGDAGVGKTALVEELAIRLKRRDAPRPLRGREMTSLNLAALIAGARYRGQFEERVLSVIKSLKEQRPILLVEDIHQLVSTGSSRGASLDSASLLRPALLSGDLHIIGTTSEEAYSNILEKNPSFLKLFHLLRLEELDVGVVIKIVKSRAPLYEGFHGVRFTENIVEENLELIRLSLSNRALPESALDLMDRTAARVALLVALGEKSEAVVTRSDLLETLSEMSGVSYERLSLLDQSHLGRMEAILSEDIIGQEEAVSKVSRMVRTSKLGLDLRSNRPDGVFLFVGPTGVGKTELARSVAKFLFGDEEKLIRIDMSEYMERISGSRLIGTAPGYVGYYDQNQLTDPVRKNPYSVVLFDEVEKADIQVLNLLLQVFDAGRLTDGKGRTVRFHHSTIIMTSNVGTHLFSKTNVGYGSTEGKVSKELIMKEVRNHFTPEFLNRVDEIVVFNGLSQDAVVRIVDLQLRDLITRLDHQGKCLIIEPEAKHALASEGYSTEYGARNLARTLRRRIAESLAELALRPEWESAAGARVVFRDGSLIVEPLVLESDVSLEPKSHFQEGGEEKARR